MTFFMDYEYNFFLEQNKKCVISLNAALEYSFRWIILKHAPKLIKFHQKNGSPAEKSGKSAEKLQNCLKMF